MSRPSSIPVYNSNMSSPRHDLSGYDQVVDDLTASLLRTKPGWEKIQLASRMFAASRERLRHFLMQQHPDWSSHRISQELLRRIHGTR
jgi:hypothetical protein